jgi:hypothetical protein
MQTYMVEDEGDQIRRIFFGNFIKITEVAQNAALIFPRGKSYILILTTTW